MDDKHWMTEQFEASRSHLGAVAYRMLGSQSDADDAVQEAWFRLNRSDTSDVKNLRGWLTTVVSRVCLDMLRSRRSRREEPLDAYVPDPIVDRDDRIDPEQQSILADSVGLALLVVLEMLDPAERLAFVLHDMFGVSFDEIANIVDRSPEAARQLASRARRRVHGADTLPDTDIRSLGTVSFIRRRKDMGNKLDHEFQPRYRQPRARSRVAGYVHDFDFLNGDWRVHHRYLRVKEDGREWLDADGTASHRELMDGRANLEEYTTNTPSGAYRAVALRSYDPKTFQWSIWWLDGRTPHSELDPPVQGRFEKGVGTFYGQITTNGKPMRLRFVWSQITGTSARWEQAYSPDAGKTWETNWTMEFRRAL